jgi:hypothetical protein
MFEDQAEDREKIYHFTHSEMEYVVSEEEWTETFLIENGYTYDCYYYSKDNKPLFWTHSIR